MRQASRSNRLLLSTPTWLARAGALIFAVIAAATAAPIQLDPAFNVGSGANGTVSSTAVGPDGKLWIGGTFTSLNGQPQLRIAKLDSDGNVDPSFAPPYDSSTSGTVHCIVPLDDGKVLIGCSAFGSGTSLRQGVVRLNANGSVDTTFNASASINGSALQVLVLPDGKILAGGSFTKGITRLQANGSPDPTFNLGVGTTGTVRAIELLPSGKFLVGGTFTSFNGVPLTNLCRLNMDGTLDTTFGSSGSGTNATVYDIASDANGRLLVAGTFTSHQGVSRKYLMRLNESGTSDPHFLPTISSSVISLAPLIDGRIMIGGEFTTVDGTTSRRIAILHADGKLDTSFETTTGALGLVWSILPLNDGKILLGGDFSMVADSSSARYAKIQPPGPATRPAVGSIFPRAAEPGGVVRMFGSSFSTLVTLKCSGDVAADFTRVSETEIHVTIPQGSLPGPLTLISATETVVGSVPFTPLPVPPGTLDASLDVGSGANNTIYAVAKDPEGRVLIAGNFSAFDGRSKDQLARLNPDGSMDLTFHPSKTSTSARCLAIQSDGKILVGGSNIGGPSGAARLHQDGTFDDSFDASSIATNTVNTVAVQADGKVLIGGSFPRGIARLHPNGSPDLAFDVGSGFGSGFGNGVNAIRLQTDGRILIGGGFSSYNGLSAKYVTRLLPDGRLDPSFVVTGTGVSGTVSSLALQMDGSVVIGGIFNSINGKSRYRNLARLRLNGALDESFYPSLYNVNSVEVTADGRIAVGGEFTGVNDISRNHVALLHADGELVTAFNTTGGPSDTVHSLLPEIGGSLLIGGAFQSIGGQLQKHIARLGGDAGKTRPGISALSPISGVPGGRLIISGSNLGHLTSAEFSGNASATIFPFSETRAELEIPVGAMSGPVTLRNAFGETTSRTLFKLLTAPPPVITGLPESSVTIGGAFTVTGENFHDVTSVRMGVAVANFVVNSATSMTVTVPPNALTAPLILAGPGGTTQSLANLVVIPAPPAFTSASTASGTVGQNFNFTIKASANTTSFTAAPLPTGLSLNPATGQISGIPTSAGATSVAISATNEGGTSSSNLTITIAIQPFPVITSVFPNEVAVGGKFLVVGNYLFQTTSVTVGGVSAAFELISDNRIAVVMPAGVASGTVRVTTPRGSQTGSTTVTRWNFQSGSQIVTHFGDSTGGLQTQPPGLNDVIAVDGGNHHSLALRADGSIAGWGANWAGQIAPPPNVLPAVAIAAGGYHSLALQTDGTVAAWGRNDEGQCSVPGGLSNIAAIAAGDFHSLALTPMGTVKAWGSNAFGQTNVPSNLAAVVAIAAGANFSVALKSDGTLVAWGDNSTGQTDIPTTATNIVAITAGMAHVVALKADGTLIGWGANWAGQLLFPAVTSSPITSISAGSNHTIALRANGSCVSWGANWIGQTSTPTTTNAIAIAAGADFSLILRASSPTPRFSLGLVATGKPAQAFSLAQVIENGPATFTAAGLPPGLNINPQTGAITGTPSRGADSLVTLTARNSFGISRRQIRLFIGPYLLGWGRFGAGTTPPVIANPVKIALGYNHGLALLNNGTVIGWGNSSNGELNIPAGLNNVIDIKAGYSFSVALKSDGTVYAWGRKPSNSFGPPIPPSTTPIATGVVAIDTSGNGAVVLMANGTAKSILGSFNQIPFGSDLVNLSCSPDSSNFRSPLDSVAITRGGEITDFLGTSYSSGPNFIRADFLSDRSYQFRSVESPVLAIHRDGRLFEFQEGTSSYVFNKIIRPETSNAVEIAGAEMFAVVLNADATAFTLAASPNPNDSDTHYPPPYLTTDTLVDISAITTAVDYAMVIKDPVTRARFTSQQVTDGRVGQSLTHHLTTNIGTPTFSAPLLPAGLSLNSTTGVISGSPSAAGTFNFVAIATFPTYFISQTISLKITSGTPPVNITLTGSSLDEAQPTNTIVGTFSTTDFTPSDTFTYGLVTGIGSTDNSSFKISGNQLLTNSVLNFESKSTLSIRVQVTDSGGNSFSRVFQISLSNVLTDDDDGDGLNESEELQLGTNPSLRDSDQDGAGDGMETSLGTHPLSPASKPSSYVSAWGLNTEGQCNVPNDLGPVIAVAAGNYHTLALKEDGTVAAWGLNSNDQCNVPHGLQGVVSIAAGYDQSFALKADGTVVAWGRSSPTLPNGLTEVIEISAESFLAAAIKADGQVVAWGSSSNGSTNVPSAADGSVHISVGGDHILTLNRSGKTVGWGLDTNSIVSGPTSRDDISSFVAGSNSSLALANNGRVQAWGSSSTLKIPADLQSVISLDAGSMVSVAINSEGRLFAWGSNSYQQTNIPAGLGPVRIAKAGTAHVVALIGSSPQEKFTTASVQTVVGLPVSQQIGFSGTADRFNAFLLPPGLSFNTQSSSIEGIPQQKGIFKVRMTAEKGFSRISEVITVICENPRRFEEWAEAHFPGQTTNPLADSDGDSVSNLLEYALNRNPLEFEAQPPVTLSMVDVDGTTFPALRYTRYKDAIDIRWIVKKSNDLTLWSPTATTVSITDHGDTETVIIRDTVPLSSTCPQFMRLKVESIAHSQ